MMNNRNGQWSFIDMLTMFDTFLQMADFEMNVKQASNDDIMQALENITQNLDRIIENQTEIKNKLAEIG